jgi:hypothetical protein
MACTAGLAVAAAAAPVVGVSNGRSRRITGATTQIRGTTTVAAAARGRAPLTVVSDADAEGTMRREGSAPRRGRGGGRGGGDMRRGGRGGGG